MSVICIIAAGILNAASQDSLKLTLEMLSQNVQKLAEPANVRKDLSVDDILAAAASKLREQDAQIKTLQSEVNTITHPPNAFYLNNSIVATALGAVQRTDKNSFFSW